MLENVDGPISESNRFVFFFFFDREARPLWPLAAFVCRGRNVWLKHVCRCGQQGFAAKKSRPVTHPGAINTSRHVHSDRFHGEVYGPRHTAPLIYSIVILLIAFENNN